MISFLKSSVLNSIQTPLATRRKENQVEILTSEDFCSRTKFVAEFNRKFFMCLAWPDHNASKRKADDDIRSPRNQWYLNKLTILYPRPACFFSKIMSLYAYIRIEVDTSALKFSPWLIILLPCKTTETAIAFSRDLMWL